MPDSEFPPAPGRPRSLKRLAKLVLKRARRARKRRLQNFQPRLIMFDFDGTIGDTFNAGHEILNLLAEEFSFRPLAAADIPQARDMRLRELIKFLGIPATKLPRISRRGTEELARRIDSIQPLPGVPQALRELHAARFDLGIITSNSEENVRTFLRNHELELFGFVRSCSKLLGKAREIRVARKLGGYSRNEVLFVGDETRDIEACKKARVRIAAATWGYNSVRSLENLEPEFVLTHPGEILPLVEGFRRD